MVRAPGAASMSEHERPPIAFGPVRSRRLGWSLGINNVPPKTCTYSCVYCQLGATDRSCLNREAYLAPQEVEAAVEARLAECRVAAQPVDYATFVPDGEPTLDWHLGAAIQLVASLGPDVAVITNGSLLWRYDVRAELAAADLVSIKVDTVDDQTWRRINRPIGSLRLETVLDGMRRFATDYGGTLLTETMLVAGINDDERAVRETAAFVSALEPMRAYVGVPTRPPAEPLVRPPAAEVVRRAAEILRSYEVPTSCLVDDIDELERPFAASDDPARGLLGILAVHPMTESVARDYLIRSGGDWHIAQDLIATGRIVPVRHGRHVYLRSALTRDRSAAGTAPGHHQHH
jgi:wyosine [tRNA(Phe)-imidazoG37] synthetase (radical SAM superfamily)